MALLVWQACFVCLISVRCLPWANHLRFHIVSFQISTSRLLPTDILPFIHSSLGPSSNHREEEEEEEEDEDEEAEADDESQPDTEPSRQGSHRYLRPAKQDAIASFFFS